MESPSLIFVLIFISDFFLQFFCGKTAEKNRNKKSEKKSEQKSEHQAEDLPYGSVNSPPVFWQEACGSLISRNEMNNF